MKFREKVLLKNFVITGLVMALLLFLVLHFGGNNADNFEDDEDIKDYTSYSKAEYISYPPVMEYSRGSYPIYESLLTAIERWNPDDPDPPKSFQETLQHFNYR